MRVHKLEVYSNPVLHNAINSAIRHTQYWKDVENLFTHIQAVLITDPAECRSAMEEIRSPLSEFASIVNVLQTACASTTALHFHCL